MTQFVFTELLGGRVLRIDDLDESSLESVGDSVLAGPSGPSFNANRGVLVAGPGLHEVALAEPGAGWTRFGTQGSGDGEFRQPCRDRFPRLRPTGRPGLGQWPTRLHRRHLRLGLGDVRTPWAGSLRRRLR